MKDKYNFRKELETLINRYSLENNSNTPDFLLADYLTKCLDIYEDIVNKNNDWHGRQNHKNSIELNGLI